MRSQQTALILPPDVMGDDWGAGRLQWWDILCFKRVIVATACSGSNSVSLSTLAHSVPKVITSYISLEETKIIDRFSDGGGKDVAHTVFGHPRQTGKLVQYRLTMSAKRAALHSTVNWVWFSERRELALFSCATQGCFSLPSSSTAEAAQGHERLEAKWRPLVYPPWKPSHALSSTWGIWWKPFVSTPLNYQPEEEPLMLSSDNGSQQPADYSAH